MEPTRPIVTCGREPTLGGIARDVVGSLYEFRQIKTTDFPLFGSRSDFTDDTVTKQPKIEPMPDRFDRTRARLTCPLGRIQAES